VVNSHGLALPVQDCQIAVGSWRLIAWAKKQGVPEALGMTTEEWVKGRLGGYIRLSIEDRREAVRDLTDEGHSAREIADIVGVSHDTAARDVRNLTPREKYEAEIAEGCTVEDLSGLVGTKKFGTIYADPPWLYDNQGTRAATKNHYDGLTVSELCKLPLRELAADDAHLHLWTTNAFIFECPRLFKAWGFEFRSSMSGQSRRWGSATTGATAMNFY
jgi:hypothetical protein